MASSISLHSPITVRPGPQPSVRFLLRLEGLAGAAISLALYARFGAGWALFFVLWFVPDLALFAYLRNPDFGARVYNALHSYVTPATLGLIGFLLHGNLAIAVALIWTNHISIDRLFGYGLKHPADFSNTHLGRVGRGRAKS
ncbi:MAG: DUF4260 domain-containing protein [Terracidiphilus sp.]|nr:DUF4260 domain-containing protein [Terracidiphilus sp.]